MFYYYTYACLLKSMHAYTLYVTVPGKTDHFVIISDFDMLIPC